MSTHRISFPQLLPTSSAMVPKYSKSKGRERVLPLLNTAIEALNLAKEISTIPPIKAVFGTAGVLLAMIRDSMANKQDYTDLGLSCAEVCQVLDRGLNGRQLDELNSSVLAAIGNLTGTVTAIQEKVAKQGKRNMFSRIFHAKDDKEAIVGWKQELTRILQIFNTELAINTHTMVADIHRNALADGEGARGQRYSTQIRTPPGESPPSAPWACFGRGGLIEKIVGLAESLKPVALIGAPGIGKTSIALTILHHDRIKDRFGDNRRFIRCDKFPPSRSHFLCRLSEVIGAGVENPEGLTALQPFLSSRDMILFLDNAESILDPQGAEAWEIYSVVEELSCFRNICLGITSRISTVPPRCRRPVIPALSMEAACDIFYGICSGHERTCVIGDLLRRLDFHALSITLLATAASHSMWDHNELAREWHLHRARVLRTDYNESLAATIELSLASPTFQKLGPNARNLLEVVAFFPRGIDKNNLNWLFPTISHKRKIFDQFRILSLTYRTKNFITMLAPIRDYLRPRDPKSSSLLRATRDLYFNRLSVTIDPGRPGFEEAAWIKSENVNVEHLLNVFISIDPNSGRVWTACIGFVDHLYWHKKRLTMLGPKIEALPDDHRFKPKCLFALSRLFNLVGNHAEQKRLLLAALKLMKERGDDLLVARTLGSLSSANQLLGLREEGIQQAKEALEILERLGNTAGQVQCIISLASLLCKEGWLHDAEEAAFRAIAILPEKGQDFQVCQSHHLLGDIYHSKGEKEKAVVHFGIALGIASSFNWHGQLFQIHYSLARLSLDQGRLLEAHAHVERAKLNATDNKYHLGHATLLRAKVWRREGRFGEAKSEALCALGIFEKLGGETNLEACRNLLRKIERSAGT